MFQTKVVKKIKKYILCSITFSKNCAFYDNEQKHGRAKQATDGDMIHVLCMLDNQGYRHTLLIRNTYCLMGM
jgi:hypothetical protein